MQRGSYCCRSQNALAAEVDAALREIGFIAVVNHGVDERTIRRAWHAVEGFFSLPVEAKMAAPRMTEAYPYGYSPLFGETLARGRLEEEASLDDHLVPDAKEMFATGPYDPWSGVEAPRYPYARNSSEARTFEAAWHGYYVAMEHMSATLLRLLARALGLADDAWFEPFADRHTCAMRALSYPSQTLSRRTAFDAPALVTSPHTDYGSLTILRSGGPGLEVRNRTSGAWIPAPRTWRSVAFEIRSHFIVNLGDLMSRWTDDRWVSTPHRVQAVEGHTSMLGRLVLGRKMRTKQRQSIAFFHNLNADALVETIPTCLEDGRPPKYAPIRAFDHLMQKHRASTRGGGPDNKGDSDGGKNGAAAEAAANAAGNENLVAADDDVDDDGTETPTPAPSFKPPTAHGADAEL